MNITRKLLITSRDPASANDIKELLKNLLKDKKNLVKVLAQSPALQILKKEFIQNKFENNQLVEFKENEDNYSFIEEIFDNFQPDILLTGISGPDSYGVDELALNISSNYKKIKTFSIQSYWGDLNKSCGVLADTIFVLDNFAKEITLQRDSSLNVVVTGSLRSNFYNNIDVNKERNLFKCNYPLIKNKVVIGLFGQPLFDYYWYRETIEIFVKCLKSLNYDIYLVYKPHPKESEASIKWVSKIISNNIKGSVNKEIDTYSLLVGCDLAVSLFSTVGFDLQNILFRSRSPFSIPMYLFFHKDCREWFKKYSRLNKIPLSENNMSILVDDKNQLKNSLQDGLFPKNKNMYLNALINSSNFNEDDDDGSLIIISEMV